MKVDYTPTCDACGRNTPPIDEVLCAECKQPSGITPARARELLGMVRHGDIPHAYHLSWSSREPTPGGITEAEDGAIKRHWNTLEGHSTYLHALESIARRTT